MIVAYNLLWLIALPVVLIRQLLKSRKNPDYLNNISQRFGWVDGALTKQATIWVHAVSVGEVSAAIPLIKRLKREHPQKQIVLTTMTPTGAQMVKLKLKGIAEHQFIPYDFYPFVWLFLKRLQPQLLVILETELWPNLIGLSHKRKIPMVIANMRLSQRSFKGYQRIAFMIKPLLSKMDKILVQSTIDHERVAHFIDESKLITAGNLKFDVSIKDQSLDLAASLKPMVADKKTWIAASTHEGEDEIILNAHREIKKQLAQSFLVLVPRHPERVAAVISLIESKGMSYKKLSDLKASLDIASDQLMATDKIVDVLVGDTIGDLMDLYALSDVAFVAGSLEPIGGHNMLEPALLSKPVLFGPHVNNFTYIATTMIDAGAAIQVSSQQQITTTVLQLFNDSLRVKAMTDSASEMIEQGKGALDTHYEQINVFIRS